MAYDLSFLDPNMSSSQPGWWNGYGSTPTTPANSFSMAPATSGVMPSQTGSNFFDPNATGFGWNANTMKFGMDGLQFLGNIWGAWQANKLAKDQLNFTKKFSMANLNNQVSAYNTALSDRSRSRAKAEGQSAAEAQAYVDKNSLHPFGG